MPAPFVIRPIGPRDRDRLAAAFDRLSPESRRRRFLAPKKLLTPRELDRFVDLDHVTSEALIAVEPLSGTIVGVARYAPHPDQPGAADFAIVVADAWQGCGVGSALTTRLLRRAIDNGLERLTATTLWENDPARGLLAKFGFATGRTSQGVVALDLWLPAPAAGSVAASPCSSVS